jgi:hypothetical protein
MNQENAVRDKVTKFAKRQWGTSHPNTLNKMRIEWNPKKKTSINSSRGSDIGWIVLGSRYEIQ